MRPATLTDICHAARALLPVHPILRGAFCDRMIAQARAADLFRKRTQRCHPEWGTGTLSDVARMRGLRPEPAFCDQGYAACLALVFERLTRERLRRGQAAHRRS